MISLPRHLSPWAPQLKLFPADVALILGRMACQLADLIDGGRLDDEASGTPNGYDGVAGRGAYERLLPSEWLLLDEAPEEFLRRAVSGEHMFLRQAWRRNAAAKRCVALFDSGAEQLGAPRIAQLAMLIVLAHRAEKHGARFEWGALQAPCATLSESPDAARIDGFLRLRCARRVLSDDLDRWAATLAAAPVSELWLIGARRLESEAERLRASSLILWDMIEPAGPQRVCARASAAGASRAREAILEIPQGDVAARLLRDPFGAPLAARQRIPVEIDPRSNILFSHGGKQLWVRGAHGSLLTFHVPNSPKAKGVPPQAFAPPEGKRVVAVAPKKWGKGTVVALYGRDRLDICVLTKRGRAIRQTLCSLDCRSSMQPAWSNHQPVPPEYLRPLSVLSHRCFCFFHDHGHVEIRDDGWNLGQGQTILAARTGSDGYLSVASVATSPGSFGFWHTTLDAAGKIRKMPVGPVLPPLPRDTRFFFAPGQLANLAAYSPETSTCLAYCSGAFSRFEVPRDHAVVGMIPRGSPPAATQVLIDQSRTRIELLEANGRKSIITTAVPIVYAAVSDQSAAIAYVTENGELGVYLCWNDGMALRVAAGETP